MSEFYERQKKPSSNSRELPIEHLDKTNPSCKLTVEESKGLI